MKYLSILLAGLVLTGCATTPAGNPDPRDPWETFNRKSFAFNDALDRAVAKPVAKGYVKVTPRFVRTGVSNFFNNLDTITTVFNDVLQGKLRQAGHDSGRFLLNTTLGFGGLFDPASAAGLENNDEDFGQTLGKWGVKSGPYLMIPILGPSTVRDAFGRIPDQFTYPPNYLKDSTTQYALRAVSFVDLRASLLDIEKQMNESPDRYAFVRNAWLQNREFKVTDGEGGSLEDEALKDDTAPSAENPAQAISATRPQGNGMTSETDNAALQRLPPLLLLHPDDNIVVARRDIAQGERVEIDGEAFLIPAAIELGHKLARRALAADARVLKYGAPIGSMKMAAARGEHVHLHNLRSDYLPSTSRDLGGDGGGH